MSRLARAEALADTAETGDDIALIAGRCRATGLDPASYAPIMGAAMALGPRAWTATDCPYHLDRELIDDLLDQITAIAERQQAHARLHTETAHAHVQAARLLDTATPQTHPDDLAGWRSTISDCTAAAEALSGLRSRLRVARTKLTAAPAQLGETYQAVYTLLEQGRVMPYNGRWLTGETTAWPNHPPPASPTGETCP